MKNFINVLYRRILYKIPLKLLLILLAVFGVLFACYSSALDITIQADSINMTDRRYQLSNNNDGYLCVFNDTPSSYLGVYNTFNDINSTIVELAYLDSYCTNSSVVNMRNNYGQGNVKVVYFPYSVYTSQQCQTEYNLIPINEVDSSYCQSNNLCPSGGTPSDCPNVGVSNIWINDIFHPGAFNVIMNIPEEIDRDYAYTNSGQNMNIDVVGYNVDYDYIDGVVDSQNYKPTSEEFSVIVSQIIPLFVPGLCIILLLYFIFRFIKKIF